jgi:hypothetical protein
MKLALAPDVAASISSIANFAKTASFETTALRPAELDELRLLLPAGTEVYARSQKISNGSAT